jgi:hypothetical protein
LKPEQWRLTLVLQEKYLGKRPVTRDDEDDDNDHHHNNTTKT